MRLIPIMKADTPLELLYQLLKEREPHQNISHKEMPTWHEHQKFVFSQPYAAWYFIEWEMDRSIETGRKIVGAIYLTHHREIGIQIFKKYRGHGYATAAIKMLMEKWPGKFLANINPANEASIKLFQKFGFQHIQNTYALEP